MHKRNFARYLLALGLAVLLAGCGLSSEPPIVSTARVPTLEPTTRPDAGTPPARVSVARGKAIFESLQFCAACHGVGGKWDGPSATGFTCPTNPNLIDPGHGDRSISDWFVIVSNGKRSAQLCIMPPWDNTLDAQQRWDVTSYAYSLRYTPALLTRGAQIWAADCASCHGARGAGDGPQAASAGRPVPDFASPAYLVSRSDADLWLRITEGVEGLPDHTFADKYSDTDRFAAIAYMRAQTWEGTAIPAAVPETVEAPPPAPTDNAALAPTEAVTLAATAAPTSAPTAEATAAATAAPFAIGTPAPTIEATAEATAPGTPEPTTEATAAATAVAVNPPAPGTLTIRGTMSVGTPGVAMPAGQQVSLRLIESNSQDAQRFDATVQPDGSYAFENVPRREGLLYIVITTYAGVVQFSAPVTVDATTPAQLDMPLTVYEVTDDASVVVTEVQRTFVDLQNSNRVLIQQAARFRNTSDRIYVSRRRTETSQAVGLYVYLPPAAQSVTVSQDVASSFAPTIENGSQVVVGLLPLAPSGTSVLQFSYELPYSGGDLTITARTLYRIDTLTVTVPQSSMKITSPGFTQGNPISLQSGVYDEYTRSDPLPANSDLSLTVQISGDGIGTAGSLALIVLAGLVVLAGGAVIVAFMRRSTPPASPAPTEDPEDLIRALAALDDWLARGEITGQEYDIQRAALKKQLSKLLDRDEK